MPIFHFAYLVIVTHKQWPINVAFRFCKEVSNISSISRNWNILFYFQPSQLSFSYCYRKLNTWNSLRQQDWVAILPPMEAWKLWWSCKWQPEKFSPVWNWFICLTILPAKTIKGYWKEKLSNDGCIFLYIISYLQKRSDIQYSTK